MITYKFYQNNRNLSYCGNMKYTENDDAVFLM